MMDISDLQVFCAVAHTGGVTKAAERLHRVPSNVTTRLRQLEDDLGTQLFLRESKRMSITSSGQLLLGYAERILSLALEAREALQDPTPRGRLRVGAMESTAAMRLPGPLADYHQRYPLVRLELSTGPSRQLVARVLGGELDAAFVADPREADNLESHEAFTEELVLITEFGHKKIRSPKDLSSRTMLAFGDGCTYRRCLEDWFSSGGVNPENIIDLSSYHAILGCAVAGMGVALMPRRMLDIFPERARLTIHEVPVSLRRSKTLFVWRKGAGSVNVAALAQVLTGRIRLSAA
jgi:DNA-binding transcriptional LysR family regulator